METLPYYREPIFYISHSAPRFPQKFCIDLAFNFSWDNWKYPREILHNGYYMQNFGG